MPDITIPEPGDRAIVGWIDPNGDWYAVYHRQEAYAEENGGLWYNADLYESPHSDPMAWRVLLHEMDDMRGPYLLNVGELLGGTE